uniref:Tail protein n=1 Tax=Caudovirales sp. ctu3532 TaxID=2827639 RepID=A0A8S5TJE3_9CAUD|nr:MAG TPA: tail protein [Caudovirales sp. ctu3532]
MIKSLRQARMTDGLPRVLAKQEWVIALSEALGLAVGKTLDYTDESQIYTRLDAATEAVLDVLAVDWKIDWYDTALNVEQKRRIVKTALAVRRLMGTAAAVKMQVHAIYPDASVEEWFQYDGRPGCFRVTVPLPEEGITAAEYRRLKTGILTTKNERSHLDVIDIRHESEGEVITGGCCTTKQLVEVWPELVSGIEATAECENGGAVSVNSTQQIWPELAQAIEILVEQYSGAAAQTGQRMEVWPEVAAVLEITVNGGADGVAHMSEALEVWPEADETAERYQTREDEYGN